MAINFTSSNPPPWWCVNPVLCEIGNAIQGVVTGVTNVVEGSFYLPPNPNPAAHALAVKVHNTLVQYPGAYGICAALDEAEQFPGFINDLPVIESVGLSTLTAIGDMPAGILQSVVDTITANAMPAVIRGTLILTGLVLIFAFLWALSQSGAGLVAQMLESAK